MNYFNYAIKCIIRNIIYKLMKPRVLIVLLISLLIIILLSRYTTVFGWTGYNDYTDKNNTITITYESIVDDFIIRLRNTPSNNSYIDDLNACLNNDALSFYVYYGDKDGSSMNTANYFSTQWLNIVFYSRGTPSPTISSQETYFGMNTSIYNITNSIQDYFCFTNGDLVTFSKPSAVSIPGVLISYTSSSWSNYLNNDSQEQTDSVVGAINNQTNAINQQTNTIQEQTQVIEEQTEAIISTDFDENEVSIDTSSTNINDTTERGLFSTIFTSFNNSINNTNVEYLDIPLVNSQSLRIPSNIVSSHLGGLTALINAFWYFVFGFYAFKFVNNLLVKIKDGSILDGYTSNEVITSDMM